MLTIDDLLDGRLRGCRLAVASACQSGHYSLDETPSEFTGLPAGFLQAGAACSVVSLWQIDDYVVSLLMTRFYELLDPSKGNTLQQPVEALRQARCWLRRLTKQRAVEFVRAHPEMDHAMHRLHAISLSEFLISRTGATPFSEPKYWAAFTAWGS
jgi:CHAT domain-containing protein